jgi:HAD superfamily hydrolase (TIGR01509 family)
MIEAVIFDLDGIIIDSEPIWKEVEYRVFQTVGIELTPEMALQTTGFDIQSTIQYWHSHFPWKNKSMFQVYKEMMEEIQPCYETDAELKDGFLDVLQFFRDENITMAIASSTPLKLITMVLKRFHLFEFFKIIHSSENDESGKPHPAVYLNTAKKLGVHPFHCLAFEDSFHGAIAARAACMKVVVVPDNADADNARFGFADIILASLKDFKPRHFEWLNEHF